MRILLIIALALINTVATAQQSNDTLYITTNKTIHLMVSDKITYCDVGSSNILVDGTPGENILRIKAATAFKESSNLSLLSGGNFICYTVVYKEDITRFLYKHAAAKLTASRRPVNNIDTVDNTLSNVLSYKRDLYHIGIKKNKVATYVAGVYIDNDKYYISIGIKNSSSITWQLTDFKMFVSDIKVPKRSLQQLKEIDIKQHTPAVVIEPQQEGKIVLCIDKLIISRQKIDINLYEKDTNAAITLQLYSADLENAKEIN